MTKTEKELKDIVIKVSQDIMGLTTVYGPLDVDDLVQKVYEYFPDDFNEIDTDDIYQIVYSLEKEKMLNINEREEASFFTEKDLSEMKDLKELQVIHLSAKEKEFDDPQQILNYADLFHIQNNLAFNALKDFMDKLEYKDEKKKEELFEELIVCIFKLYDIDEYLKVLKEGTVSSFDEEKFMDHVNDLGAIMPRGYLHGYSLGELAELIEDELDYFEEFEMERLDKPKKGKRFGPYSYKKCLKLTKELKQTKIFEAFCSDNIIELIINGKEVYVQLLGYYNGDRNIIIYRDWEELEYDYQFIMSEAGEYPDLSFRVHQLEVVIDSIGGFLTPDLEMQMVDKKLPQLPALIDIDSIKGPILADKKDIDLIGAVLESLLQVYEDMKEEIGERCQEGNSGRIIQFHLLKDDGLRIGQYDCLWLGDPVAPFAINPIEDTIDIHAKHATDVNIGIFTMPVTDEEKLAYITILRDVRTEMVLGFDLSKEEDMKNILYRIIGKLEDIDVRPSTLTFNNAFSEYVLDELYDIYDLDDACRYENEELNNIYEMFAFGDLPTDGLIH